MGVLEEFFYDCFYGGCVSCVVVGDDDEGVSVDDGCFFFCPGVLVGWGLVCCFELVVDDEVDSLDT